VKVYLIAPKNPASFWTFDPVLPSLGKRCRLCGYPAYRRRAIALILNPGTVLSSILARRDTSRALDGLIRELRKAEPAP